jgi:hypothetical protein
MTKLLLLLSDSHVGRWTERSNLKVVGLQFRKVGMELMGALKQAPDCDEVIIALLGDIVEGENIYPAQEHFLDYVNPELLKQVFPYLEGLKETSSAHTLLQAYLAAQFIFKEVIEPVAKAGFKVRIASVVGNQRMWLLRGSDAFSLQLLLGHTIPRHDPALCHLVVHGFNCRAVHKNEDAMG